MQIDERSELLLGRYQALRVYAQIARHAKSEFTTGEIALLTDTPVPAVSKELGRLRALGAVEQRSRRGDYERVEDTVLWRLIDELCAEWDHP